MGIKTPQPISAKLSFITRASEKVKRVMEYNFSSLFLVSGGHRGGGTSKSSNRKTCSLLRMGGYNIEILQFVDTTKLVRFITEIP